MAVDFDTSLTGLAAKILREATQVYTSNDFEAWLSTCNPVLAAWNSGMFGGLQTTSSFQAVTGSFQALTGSFQSLGQETGSVGQVTLKRLFRLPRKLPGVRLPSDHELALAARSAPTMMRLEALARWLGHNGRLVTADDLLHEADAVDAVGRLGIRPDYLPYLWEHALASGWVELADDVHGRSRAVLGRTAYRWADGDVRGALHVWATVFASALATTLEVTADQAPDGARWLNFHGQGVALAVVMFLARRTGLTMDDATDIVRSGAIGDIPTGRRARKAWDAWVCRFGDPAHRLLSELAALHAVTLPTGKEDVVTLAPLAQWALREQFMLDKINVPVIRASGQLPIADFIGLVDGVSDAEFEAEFRAWLSGRDPSRAAADLLMYAGSASAQGRVTAVKLVRQLGQTAVHAWLEAMKRPQLRGYARIALSEMADMPESSLPLLLNPDPDDLGWVASDLLALIGDDDDPDPDRLAALFAEIVPQGDEGWIVSLLSGARHPDVVRLLELLAHYHPDRRLAKSARKATRTIEKNNSAARLRIPARASRR